MFRGKKKHVCCEKRKNEFKKNTFQTSAILGHKKFRHRNKKYLRKYLGTPGQLSQWSE